MNDFMTDSAAEYRNQENDKVLYRNDQWMVIQDGDKIFLSESRSGDPAEVVTGYEVAADHFDWDDKGYSEITALCDKSWVSVPLFVDAYRFMHAQGFIKPTHDFESEIIEVLRRSLRRDASEQHRRIDECLRQATRALEMPR